MLLTVTSLGLLISLIVLTGYDMSKLLDKRLDGIDFWSTLSSNVEYSPRTEFLYNIDREIKCSALRVNDMKILIGQNYGNKFNGWLPLLKVMDVITIF